MGLAMEDSEAEARLRSLRARKALGQAPELAQHLRSLVQVTDGRTERGVEVEVARTPLHTGKTDDADELYVRLLEWVAYWSRLLEFQLTPTAIVAWSNPEGLLGFKAGTTPGGAAMLVRLQTMWLLGKDLQIGAHPSAGAYHDDVTGMVWGFRAKYGMTPVRERLVSGRPCSTCGELAVHASWRSDEITDVEIVCERCGGVVEAPRASLIELWVQESSSRSVRSLACLAGDHGRCEAVSCECSCHESKGDVHEQ